jgi:hypothetical protein
MFQRYHGQLILKVSELEEMASATSYWAAQQALLLPGGTERARKALASKEPLALMLLDLMA